MKHNFNLKRIVLNLVTLSLLTVSFTGCGEGREDARIEVSTDSETSAISESSTEDTTENDITENDTTENDTEEITTETATTEAVTTAESATDYTLPGTTSQNADAYKSVLDQYHTALSENWDYETLINNNLNYMCILYNNTGLTDIGYAFYDIDGNGTNELLIGLVSQDNRGGDVFDIYTLIDDKPVMLAQSGERDMYTLCQNGMISEAGSNSAASSFYKFYEFKSGTSKLTLKEAVVIDGQWDSDNPYFYTTTDTTDKSACTAITEDDADGITQKYTAVKISFTPFDHY